MQATAYPTLSAVVPWYLNMIVKLKCKMAKPGTSTVVELACQAALDQLDEYHTAATNQVLGHSNVAMSLNPRMNLRGLDNVFPGLGEDEQKRRRRAKGQF